MHFKKILCAVSAVCLLTALTACGESSASPTVTPAPAATESSAAPAVEESSAAPTAAENNGSDFSVTFTEKNGVEYDVANCDPFSLQPGNVVKGDITWCEGPVATFSQGSTIMINRMKFFAVEINETYVLYGAPNSAGASGSLSLLASQVTEYATAYQQNLSEEELEKKRPWMTAPINARVEPLPQELKDLFKEWYGTGFESECVTAVYLVDEEYRE